MSMNLDKAVEAHTSWRIKLRSALGTGEKLDAIKIGQDNQCDLGKWIAGEGRQQFGSRPEFQALVSSHRQFHACAGQVASAINAGNKAGAEALLAGQFHAQSQETVKAIRACKKAAAA